MRPVVGIVDYQSGNVRSVANAVENAGGTVRDVRKSADMAGCTHLILPGVGAFGFCAERLQTSGLLPALEQWALLEQKPLLGICVGMQLLADYSEEHGRQTGLGWIGGAVRKLESDGHGTVRIPHVGWNEVEFSQPLGEFKAGDIANFYFDHSYAYDAADSDCEVGSCRHGRRFSALIRRNNILAAQFHPEKSQTQGMRVLRAFFAC
jgi:glutamine amidotransferase